ncbi:MAG: GntR family transcriptional regulator [Clostridia bacterium]|nr:GntR family transcriptional regulator [Clostridia bacterium]
MNFDFDSQIPIYLQIASELEDAIFTGAYPEETQIPSTTELSVTLKINPATVLKGMNILVDENIIYKKRGLGMFVTDGAVKIIRKKRQAGFFEKYILPLKSEAKKLGLSEKDIVELIERGEKNEY